MELIYQQTTSAANKTEKELIAQAALVIKKGGVVAFPTETVYGLGADALNKEAVAKIYHLKNRPAYNPLIIHVSSLEAAANLAEFNTDAYKLADLWPGPLTIVLPKKANALLADNVTGGLPTIALRIPDHQVALQLINASNCPIAAPSANQSGKLSATRYEHVIDNFNDQSQIFILSCANALNYGLESTIVDLSGKEPAILRFGFITPELISTLLNKQVIISSSSASSSVIKAPGMLTKHYAPDSKLRLNATMLASDEVGLNFGNSNLDHPASLNLSRNADLSEAARNLFNYLYKLDKYCLWHKLSTIAVAPVPNESIGLAINDRLLRASFIAS